MMVVLVKHVLLLAADLVSFFVLLPKVSVSCSLALCSGLG